MHLHINAHFEEERNEIKRINNTANHILICDFFFYNNYVGNHLKMKTKTRYKDKKERHLRT